MKSFYYIVQIIILSILTSCSQYERQKGCTLDKLNLHGNVVKVETIMNTTVPYTEMLANFLNPKTTISTLCGNLTLNFDKHGNIKEYIGYGIDGNKLFSAEEFANQKAMNLIPSIIGKSSELSFDKINLKKSHSKKIIESDYIKNGKLIYKEKAYYNKSGDIERITKSYEEFKIKVDKNTTIESVDTTYFEYLKYDKHHNWIEARVEYKGILPRQNDSYKVKRQITYDEENSHDPLIDKLTKYNEDNKEKAELCKYNKVEMSYYGNISVPDFMISKENNKKIATDISSQGTIGYLYTYGYYNSNTYSVLNISVSPNNGQVNFDELTEKDLCYDVKTDNVLKNQFSSRLSKNDIQILKWLPYQFKNINGKTALVIRYYRYGKFSPIPVYVEDYSFCMADSQMLNILYSFQSNRYNQLQASLQQAISTIQFN